MAAPAELVKSSPVTHGRDQGAREKFYSEILGRPLKPKGHMSVSGLEGRSIDWLGANKITSLPDGDNDMIIDSLSEQGLTGGVVIERRNGIIERTEVVLDGGNVIFRSDEPPKVDPRQISLF